MIKFGVFEREVDVAESFITGYVAPGAPVVHWKIEVRAIRQEYNLEYDDDDDDNYDGPDVLAAYLYFVAESARDWRQLQGVAVDVHFELGKEVRMLPDDPSGLYIGVHWEALDHRLRIGERNGNRFAVDWTFLGRWGERDDHPTTVQCRAELPFRGVVLRLRDEMPNFEDDATEEYFEQAAKEWIPDWGRASATMSTFFDIADFDEPRKWRWALFYPLRTEGLHPLSV